MARTPEFEREAVVQQAMAVFWERGYGQTSVGDLVNATGLNPGSLYAAFGSKKGLFLEVLERYNAAFLVDLDDCLSSSPSPLAALRRLLRRMADTSLGDAGRRGCLAVNALLEMAEHDADIATALRRHNETLRARLAAVLERALADGELDPGRDPDALAAFVLNNLWGMRVLCKSSPDRDALEGIIDGVMAALGAPPAAGGIH